MPKFKKKPIEIEAEQFFAGKPLPFEDRGACMFDGSVWYVITAHGQETPIVDGDWIVPEPDGEHYYPIKPDIFAATYDPA